ncbi:hypothetical protein SCALM49S_00369 [Streptomyces californicus]
MDFRTVADTAAEEIASGRLRPGERLPPQREFARRHAIADSTAARVYQELARRGLTAGHVGRGSSSRQRPGAPGPAPALSEPSVGPGSTWSSTTPSSPSRPRCSPPAWST